MDKDLKDYVKNMDRHYLLIEHLRESMNKEFNLGLFDCVRFCNGYAKKIGQDYMKEFNYDSPKEALRIIKEKGSLENWLISKLGKPFENVNYAQRGDVLLLNKNILNLPYTGEGVGLYENGVIWCCSEKGLISIPLSNAVKGWKLP